MFVSRRTLGMKPGNVNRCASKYCDTAESTGMLCTRAPSVRLPSEGSLAAVQVACFALSSCRIPCFLLLLWVVRCVCVGLRGLFTSGTGSLFGWVSHISRPLNLVNQMDLLPVAFWMRVCRLQAFSIAHPWLCVLSFLLAPLAS